MTLTQEAIDKLKAIYKRKTGEELSDEDAWEMGNRLIRIYSLLTSQPCHQSSKRNRPPSCGCGMSSLDEIVE
jgi:hypothetical protein